MENKYYLMVTIEYTDETKSSKSVYEYSTQDEAKANFHSQLGGYMKKDNVKHILAVVIDYYGFVAASETYTKIVEEEKDEANE